MKDLPRLGPENREAWGLWDTLQTTAKLGEAGKELALSMVDVELTEDEAAMLLQKWNLIRQYEDVCRSREQAQMGFMGGGQTRPAGTARDRPPGISAEDIRRNRAGE